MTPDKENGFTLTELAVVLAIVALLVGGLLMPLASQDEARRAAETRQTLTDIRDALLGYATVHRRLPCPASATSSGAEDPAGGGSCNHPYDGFVPAATLGITPSDSAGYAVDAWGHRLRYALAPATANAVSNVFSDTDGIKNATLSFMSSASPMLSVCSSGASTALTNAGTSGAACATAHKLTDSAVAVIYSLGRNYATGGTGNDEKHNPNPNVSSAAADPAFVFHSPTSDAAVDGEFDDIVVWLSPNILYNRMIAAGQLP